MENIDSEKKCRYWNQIGLYTNVLHQSEQVGVIVKVLCW